MNHSDDVSIRRFQESDLCQLVRLISETIGISYAEVYPPRAVQFFQDFHSEKKIAARSRSGQPLSSRRMRSWWLPAVEDKLGKIASAPVSTKRTTERKGKK